MDINPVTETEMRDFFERVISSVVSLSDTAKQVDQLKETLQQMQNSIDHLVVENGRLVQSEKDAWDLTRAAEAKEAEAQARANEAESKARHVAEVMVERDARVYKLECDLAETIGQKDKAVTELESANRILTEHRDELQSIKDRLEQDNQHLSSELSLATAQRDHWQGRHDTVLKDLTAIRSILSPGTAQASTSEGHDYDPSTDANYPRAVSSW